MDPTRTVRLLIVEDDPAYAYLIRKAFGLRTGEAKWELSVANDGLEAVRALFGEAQSAHPLPDLVLLDWRLPKLSGFEVLRMAKEHRTIREIPILVFSSSDVADDIHSAYGSYANGYIVKPVAVEGIASIIDAIERFWIAAAQLAEVIR
jgi:CheY-like chemotaxis protein